MPQGVVVFPLPFCGHIPGGIYGICLVIKDYVLGSVEVKTHTMLNWTQPP